jgi:hypothetical protein
MGSGRGGAYGLMSPNASFYVLGGYGGLGNPIRSYEAYDAGSDSWSPSIPLTQALTQGRAWELADGGALIVAQGTPIVSFDFQDHFRDAGPVPTAKVGAAALHPSGDVYLFASDSAGRAVQRWTAGTSSWQTVSTAPTGQSGATAVYAADGRFYVLGGAGLTAEAYSPKGDWAQVAPTNEEHRNTSAMLGEDGRIYVFFGGSNSPGNDYGYGARVEAYGPTLTVSPTTGARGLLVRVSGENFAANAPVRIVWGPLDGGVVVKTTTSSDAGTFTNVGFNVPATGDGPITAIDARARYPAFIPFTVQ